MEGMKDEQQREEYRIRSTTSGKTTNQDEEKRKT